MGDEKPAASAIPTGPKTRYEWYQTETHVIVSILVKNVKQEDVTISTTERSLSCTIRLPTGSDYSLELDLLHPVSADQTTTKILSTRVEIKLKKQDGIRWEKLESDDTGIGNVKHFNPATASSSSTGGPPSYPSSHVKSTDWDKLVSEIKEQEKDEKPEGDAALNQLFQQIYADGSDETRRAMNKSFMESGGTVLSTNWKDVGKKTVEVKPPDGMEYKKFEY